MNLETTKKAAELYRDLRKVEDKIEFFKQFVPKMATDRIFYFHKAKPPKLEVVTTGGDDKWSFFPLDDDMTAFFIQALEVKRDNLLKEIDAL